MYINRHPVTRSHLRSNFNFYLYFYHSIFIFHFFTLLPFFTFSFITGERANITMANNIRHNVKLNSSQTKLIDIPNNRKKKPSVLILIQI